MATKTKPKPKKTPKPAPAGAGAPTPPRAPQPPGLVAGPLPTEYTATLRLDQIRPSPLNPRKTFDEAGLRALAESFADSGIAQRLLVRPVGACPRMGPKGWEGTDHFELVDGERRFRAAKLAGLAEVPVTARVLTDEQALLLMLVSNDQREDVRPSERAAAYAALAGQGKTAEQVAAATGVPLAQVRDLVRLARLPDWALAAVDRGVLPVATAALVAKVPGEAARKRAACEVLLDTRLGADEDPEDVARQELRGPDPTPMSYRQAKEHLQELYTRQLKGSPFSRKSLDLLPAAGSCDACPKLAGNDPEAKADGVRADVCLDPDCYREKVKAHDTAEVVKATRKGYLMVPEDFTWPTFMDSPPKGWCDVEAPAQLGDLSADLQGTKHGPTKLGELLKLDRHAAGDGPALYGAVDPRHKLRVLIRTVDARKLLTAAGVLKKPERKPPAAKADRPATKADLINHLAGPPGGVAPATKPLVSKVSEWEADERAAVIAANVLREYAEEQCSALAELPDAAAGGPVRDALALLARALVYDLATAADSYETDCIRNVLKARFPAVNYEAYNLAGCDKVLDPALAAMTAPQLLGLLLQLSAALELGYGPVRDTGKDLLDWAELDWPQLQGQARRELEGGEPADAKIDRAEAEQTPATPSEVA